MATTRIKEKISKLVASQLPEFVQSDYTRFVAFLEAYYQFLEQDQGALELVQNARSYNDLDETVDSFVGYFLNTYAKDIPLTTEVDKRLLIKKIKDLYESKGSEISFKYLFNLLFNQTVDVAYPFENVLRASAGRWEQRVAINLVTVSGNRNLILNRSLLYTSNGQDFATPIIDVKNYSDSITQVFLDQTFLASSYTLGDPVSVKDSNGIIYTGTIASTPVSYSVLRGGSGFRAGQIYNVSTGGGLGSLIRISNVSNVGAITEVKFISYGSGYPLVNFDVDLDSTKTVAATSEDSDVIFDATQGFGSYGTVYGFNKPSDSTQGFASYGSVFAYDSTDPERYFEEEYVSSNTLYSFTSIPATFTDNVFNAASDTFTTLRFEAATFNNNVTSPSQTTFSKPPGTATIQFTPGAVGRFPGSYTTNEGFISELDIRLENDIQYQPFAYQTETELDISDFFDIITQLIHPAGQRLFNNRLLLTSFDLNSNISLFARSNIFEEALSVFDVLDNYTSNLGKLELDVVDPFESNSYVLTKPILDNVLSDDNNSLLINLVYNDSVTPSEFIQFDFATFAEHESTTDSIPTANINKAVLNISNVSISESALGTIQGYFSESYASEDYTGGSFTLI